MIVDNFYFFFSPQSFVYARGGQTFHTKGRIEKNFEAEGRTNWKSKIKKIITTARAGFGGGHHPPQVTCTFVQCCANNNIVL